MINKKDKILLLGHKGLIGSALLKTLKKQNFKNIITVEKKKLNLLSQKNVFNFFKKNKPKIVLIAAARAGGIIANMTYPFKFIYENLVIQNNLISASIKYKSSRVILLGSSCIYPAKWNKPFRESDLTLSGLEKSNEPYAIAKIAGIKMCEAYNKQFNESKPFFISIIPPNLFGENDNFETNNSHVLPALMKKFYLAKKNSKKEVVVWGSGKPKREFMYSGDAAQVIIKVMKFDNKKISILKKSKNSHLNIGSGKDYSIRELANIIKKISNFKGKIVFDKNFPDGIRRKMLNISLQKKLGLRIESNFIKNLKKTYSKINVNLIKKFEKNSTYNLPI